MANLKALARDTAIYGMSSIVGRFINYLTVPMLTGAMGTKEYGIYTDVYSGVGLLLALLTFGMETTFFRFVNKEDNPTQVFSTALTMVGVVALAFVGLVLGFLPQVAGAMGYAATPWYVGVMSATVAMDAVQAILFGLLRYQKRPVMFASLKLLFIIANLTMVYCVYVWNPAFMGFDQHSVRYTFYINLICTSTVMLVFVPLVARHYRLGQVSADMVRRMLRFTWPMLVLSVAGVLNQMIGNLMLPRVVDDVEYGRHMLGVYGACVKIAALMLLFTQAFRYAIEPIVFAGHRDKNNPAMLAQATKFFLIACLLGFLCVTGYVDMVKNLLIPNTVYHEGLGVVPIVMAAEIMMGIYFNLSFWYKLIDKPIYGAYFSLVGCGIMCVFNWFMIPRMGYWACAWAGVAGYGTAMVLSYVIGQRKSPMPYPLGSMLAYVALTALLYGAMQMVPAEWPLLVRMGINTVLILAYVGHVAWHEVLRPRRAA